MVLTAAFSGKDKLLPIILGACGGKIVTIYSAESTSEFVGFSTLIQNLNLLFGEL